MFENSPSQNQIKDLISLYNQNSFHQVILKTSDLLNLFPNSFSVFIAEPAFDLTAVVSLDSVICYADTTGSANIIVQGGTSPYSYLWQNGDTTSFVNLPAGQFNYQVIDNKGCVFTDTIQIDQPLQIQANYNVTPESCDSQDGEIQINPSGGIQPYNILWVSDPLNSTYILSNLDEILSNIVFLILFL